MTVEEASAKLHLGPQIIRFRMRHGKLPIGICVQSEGRWKYVIYEKWLDRWIEGNPVEIPEGMSDMEVETR